MSCLYHKREFITIYGVVAKSVKVYKPPVVKKIFKTVFITWLERWNVNAPELGVLKTYKFFQNDHPDVQTKFINGTPKPGDKVRMILAPISARVGSKRFCVMEVEVL